MNAIDYAQKLAAQFDVLLEDTIKAMDAEADDIRGDPFRLSHLPKPSLAYALEVAYEHIQDWLSTGHTYVVKLEWGAIAQFAMSHRKACVWAVCTAKSKAVKP